MSRIAWFCIPAWGHTNPTVEVVRRLTAAGHHVRYYSFAPFCQVLEQAGAEVVLCDEYLPPVTPGVERKMGKDFAALIEMTASVTLAMETPVGQELAAFRPDAVVSDSMAIWGKLLAKKLGIPQICSTTTFAFNQHTARLLRPSPREMLTTVMGMKRVERQIALLRNHGYPVSGLPDLIQTDNETDAIVYTTREFQPMAETFSSRVSFVGPSVMTPAVERSANRRPLVYVSLGTVMNRQMSFYRNCLAAFSGGSVDVVLSLGGGDPSALGTPPAGIRVERRVDQLEILSRADVFVTHCGMNSANEAIWQGVPTVLFPQQSEEAAVADRMEALGLGLRLRRGTPAAIRQAVERVLTEPSFRQNTLALSERFHASGGAAQAAQIIADIAAERSK